MSDARLQSVLLYINNTLHLPLSRSHITVQGLKVFSSRYSGARALFLKRSRLYTYVLAFRTNKAT